MRVAMFPKKKKEELVAIEIEFDRDVIAAMQRLETEQGIPLRTQVRLGMVDYLHTKGKKIMKVEP